MAETITFKVPQQASFEDPYITVNWYQSVDGIIWDVTPIDSAIISSLPSSSGDCIFDSLLASSTAFNYIKFADSSGVESPSGYILPPKDQIIEANMKGVLIAQDSLYNLGDTVQLFFRLDDAGIAIIGDNIRVDLLDEKGSIIDVIIATRIGSLYIASWQIPFNLNEKLLSIGHFGNNEHFISITDRWILKGSYIDYTFEVLRNIENPIGDNNIYYITVSGITDAAGKISKSTSALFTSKLSPYYSTVELVRNVYPQSMGKLNDFALMKEIYIQSLNVDLHMRPDVIYEQASYDNAVANYVCLISAYGILSSQVQQNLEEKQIDTFRYKVTTADPTGFLKEILSQARAFALIIWAGGKDTPFHTRVFEKGLYDPNRPTLVRSNLDNNDYFPYINRSFRQVIQNINGNDVEVRGYRGVAHYSSFNKYLAYDSYDVGYLAKV